MTCTPSCVRPTPAQAHCASCHRTFSGITLFDRHRRDGKCLPIPGDMPMRLREVRGVWRFAAPRPSFGAKESACCAFHDRDDEPCAPDDLGGYCCDACPTLATSNGGESDAR